MIMHVLIFAEAQSLDATGTLHEQRQAQGGAIKGWNTMEVEF